VSAEAHALPGIGTRMWRLMTIVLVFIIVGPPVGAMAFVLSTALIGMGMKVDLAGLTWIGLFALIYAVPLSYLIGVAPAAAVGLLVGVRQAFFGAIRWPYALLIGLASGLALLVLSGQPIIPVPGSDAAQPIHIPVLLSVCLSATFACWAIVRNWYFEPELAK
jgi:hypothetical protein